MIGKIGPKQTCWLSALLLQGQGISSTIVLLLQVFGGATSSLEKIDPTTGESSLVDRSLTSSESFFDTENQDVFLYLQQ